MRLSSLNSKLFRGKVFRVDQGWVRVCCQVGDDYASPFVVLHPEQQLTAHNRTFTMHIDVDVGNGDSVDVYVTSTETAFQHWTKVGHVSE